MPNAATAFDFDGLPVEIALGYENAVGSPDQTDRPPVPLARFRAERKQRIRDGSEPFRRQSLYRTDVGFGIISLPEFGFPAGRSGR